MKKAISLLLMLVLVFTLAACSSGSNTGDYIAKVNEDEITYTDYQKNFAIFKKQIESTVGSDIWTQDSGQGKTYNELFKEQILEKMIDEQLIMQEAEKMDISVSEEEINAQFEDFKTQVASLPDYQAYLDENEITDDFIKAQLRKDTIVQAYKNEFITSNEVSEEDIRNFYDENIEEFKANEVKASHILIKTVDDNMVPLAQDIVQEKRETAQDLLDRINGGEDFAALAKEFSEDPASAVNGGDLGYFRKGVMVKEFEEAAFSLQPGEVSELVESSYGYHIIKLVDIKDETTSFEDAKEGIKTTVSEEAYNEKIQQLRDSSEIDKNEELLKEEAK